MALTTIISGAQSRGKDSYSSSPSVGLALRANGEEQVKVINAAGQVFRAGIDAPTVAPTPTAASGGSIPDGWRAYVYVYASSRFPFVKADLAINGLLYPRGNQSPYTAVHFTGGNNQITAGTVTKTTAAGIDTIWIFRTAGFSSQLEAETAAAAGDAFFVAQVVNNSIAGIVAFTDNTAADSADQVQTDNYVAPQFQFAVFYDPYWWGFGNMPFSAAASWNNTNAGSTGKITLTAGDTWFNGRDGQNVTLTGITTGGIDGNGTFKILNLTSTTATVTLNGVTPVALPSTGSGTVLVQGPSTTLYRSKAGNPFSWGFTEVIGDTNIPQQYAFFVGGGMGTAIAVVPNSPTLKLDTEYPAKCYTLNLRSAGTSAFEATLRIISDVYSITAHFSQFAALTPDGQNVLWGVDFKNFAILQSDGVTQKPISGPIPKIMRSLTTDRTRQLLTHGIYDPASELNCIWVASSNSLSLVNYLIYMHAPSGFWGFSDEKDLLCSASIEDTLTGNKKTFAGTQTGILGQILVKDVWNNWNPDTGAYTGTVTSATSTAITTAASFNIVDPGIVGNWCLVTDSTGQQEQWARVSAVTLHTLTFNAIRAFIGGGTAAFNPVPTAGYLFYLGLIECSLEKYFDFNLPQTNKRLKEMWITQQGVDAATFGTIIRMYRERETTYSQFAPLQNVYDDSTNSDVWYQNTGIPSELMKMFKLQFINRGYDEWRFINLTLKPNIDP